MKTVNAKNTAAAKKSLNTKPRKTVAEACAPKRGRPSNAEKAERDAKEAKAAERLAKREAKNKPAGKKVAAKEKEVVKAKRVVENDGASDKANAMIVKSFKKAIKLAAKKSDDMELAADVRSQYKDNRKLFKDALPKHAVNAFEKSLAAKKDEKLLAKSVEAANKHIVEKDFML